MNNQSVSSPRHLGESGTLQQNPSSSSNLSSVTFTNTVISPSGLGVIGLCKERVSATVKPFLQPVVGEMGPRANHPMEAGLSQSGHYGSTNSIGSSNMSQVSQFQVTPNDAVPSVEATLPEEQVDIVHIHSTDGTGLTVPRCSVNVAFLPSSSDGREDSEAGRPEDRGIVMEEFLSQSQLVTSLDSVGFGDSITDMDIPRPLVVTSSANTPFFGCIELFAGVGSLSRSITQQGGHMLAVCEQDSGCLELLKTRHPSVQVELDVTKIRWDSPDWRRFKYDAEYPLTTGCVLMGGPPCSPYSLAGPHLDQLDTRADLMLQMVKATSHILPELVILENVPAFQDSNTYRQMVSEFADI